MDESILPENPRLTAAVACATEDLVRGPNGEPFLQVVTRLTCTVAPGEAPPPEWSLFMYVALSGRSGHRARLSVSCVAPPNTLPALRQDRDVVMSGPTWALILPIPIPHPAAEGWYFFRVELAGAVVATVPVLVLCPVTPSRPL